MSAILPANFRRLLLLVVLALAGGCGLKGDLYLPDPETPVQRPAAPDASEPPAGDTPEDRQDPEDDGDGKR